MGFTFREQPPAGLDDKLKDYLTRLVTDLQIASNIPSVIDIVDSHIEPTKLYDHQIVFADGTDWNPGSGRGLYYYDTGVPGWVFIA